MEYQNKLIEFVKDKEIIELHKIREKAFKEDYTVNE